MSQANISRSDLNWQLPEIPYQENLCSNYLDDL